MSYHIRRNDREITDQNKIYDIIKNNKYAIIALCYNNEPYIVTLSYGFDEKDKSLYFHSAKSGQKIDIINKNNKENFMQILNGSIFFLSFLMFHVYWSKDEKKKYK